MTDVPELDQSDASELASMLINNVDDDQFLKAAGIYYIYGEISSGSLKDTHQGILVKSLLFPKKFNSDITLIINSPGGDASETDALLDLLANIKPDIRTVGMGMCASAGAMLLAAGTKGKRTCGKSTDIMIHQYSSGVMGKHQELVAHRIAQDNSHERDVEFWMKHSRYRSKKDVEKYLLKTEDHWMTAKEALSHGIIDSIGDSLR